VVKNRIKAIIVMKTNRSYIVWAVMAFIFHIGMAGETFAKKPLFEDYKRMIAIDAGHGGDDSGATGAAGQSEKMIVLRLAQILETELKREYRVILTRTDDIRVKLEERTAQANHHKADLLISIHTGGSLVHGTSGFFIYHYQAAAEKPAEPGANQPNRGQADNGPILWERAQERHLANSRILAHLIRTSLTDSGIVQESLVQGAPLLLLQGANMPAILIEIGYLTNPTEEKKLSDQRYLINLAKQITRGIDAYFEQEQ